MSEHIKVQVEVDTEELRHWAVRFSDSGHQGVAHALFDAAARYESIDKERAKAWDEGVATALNYSYRQPDGITLKLYPPHTNPYRTTKEN